MNAHDRELLRPEDATSLDEFQARRVVEQAQIRGMNSSWKRLGAITLSGILGFFAIFCWVAVAIGHTGARWFFLVLALAFTLAVVRIFGRIELAGFRGSKRYVQLDRLSKDWQARARNGEIPVTAPGGPKVWRDQVDEVESG
jgi:hypothetical protein